MEYLIKMEHVTKKYGTSIAVDSIDINIKKGSIYGIIGKNGAGKTTILKIIAGLIKCNTGRCDFNERDITIGSLIEEPGLYYNLSAYDNLKAKCLCRGCSCSEITDLLNLVGLSNAGNRKVKMFSLGMKQRLGIALALVGTPQLLILDEPINGLDPQGIIEIRNLLHKLNKEFNITIIISSHILDELSKTVTDYCIINNGHVLLEISKEELIEKSKNMTLEDFYLKVIEGDKL